MESAFTPFPPELKSILLSFHLSDKCLSPCVTNLFSFPISFLSASSCPQFIPRISKILLIHFTHSMSFVGLLFRKAVSSHHPYRENSGASPPSGVWSIPSRSQSLRFAEGREVQAFLRVRLISSLDWVVLGFVQLSFDSFQGWLFCWAPGQGSPSVLTRDSSFPSRSSHNFPFYNLPVPHLWEESTSIFCTG